MKTFQPVTILSSGSVGPAGVHISMALPSTPLTPLSASTTGKQQAVVGSPPATNSSSPRVCEVSDEDVDECDEEAPGDKRLPPKKSIRKKQRRRRQPKTDRRRATPGQVKVMEEVFLRNPYPDAETREELRKMLGMKSARQVQIWFQNKRARVKREGKQILQVGPTTNNTSPTASSATTNTPSSPTQAQQQAHQQKQAQQQPQQQQHSQQKTSATSSPPSPLSQSNPLPLPQKRAIPLLPDTKLPSIVCSPTPSSTSTISSQFPLYASSPRLIPLYPRQTPRPFVQFGR